MWHGIQFLLIILIILPFFGCDNQAFKQLSKEIWKLESVNDKSTFKVTNSFYKARKLLSQKDGTMLLKKEDTLYLLEAFDVQSGEVIGSIWNRNNKVNYRSKKHNLIIEDRDQYSQFTYVLVQNWDTLGIRKEERANSNLFGGRSIVATRAYKVNGKVKVDYIVFNEFFDLERDRFK